MQKMFNTIFFSLMVLGVIHSPIVLAEEVTQPAVSQSAQAKVNINQANLAQLVAVKGLGEKKAKSIIAYREKKGAFTDLSDLVNVSGISERLMKKISGDLTVG